MPTVRGGRAGDRLQRDTQQVAPEGNLQTCARQTCLIRDNAASDDQRAWQAPAGFGTGSAGGCTIGAERWLFAAVAVPSDRTGDLDPPHPHPTPPSRGWAPALVLGGRPTWKPARRRRSHRC